MAHPYAKHAGHKAALSRAKHITKAYGGSVGSDQAPLSTAGVKGTSAAEHEIEPKVAGKKGAPKRYARGGKTKHHTTNIFVVPHHPAMGGMPMPGPQGAPMAGPAGMPPGGMPPGGPPGGPPGMGPGMGPGLPPGLPPRARGGHVLAGAATGEGRLNAADWAKRHRGD